MPPVDDIVSRLRAAGCVFAEDEATLLIEETDDPARLEAMVQQRVAGLPLEHVLGWAEFCGMRIIVEPGVFVPRPRTEALVAAAIAVARRGSVVLDLCCGSGAVGAAIEGTVEVELHSAELDPVAARVARRNVSRVYEGNLYEPLPPNLRGRFDIIVVVAPYVPTREIALLPHEARDFEPQLALDGGADGLDLLRRIIAEAPQWLAPGGAFLTEVSERQAPAVAEALEAAGLVASRNGIVVSGAVK
jgi:release factor glutamine methyltransferase